ncbi:MAG TPA: MBL fold metallo-hydrolase [Sandaracinaceae bacterium LLY-WYZ-13_1]|nr:MBL fold metallo-hydrolase [Sandaracinaceae bacterium LLY-WYZ-13_1]
MSPIRWVLTEAAPIGWATLALLASMGPAPTQAQDDGWRVHAVEYARSEGLPARRMDPEAAPDARVDVSWVFFVAVGHERVVLIDCGTDALASREGFRRRWAVTRAVGVREALGRVDRIPAEVTDVVLTHHHWDHVGGLGHFPRATVHVHRGTWARVPARLRRPVEREDRLHLVDGSAATLAPGLTVRRTGRHTAHHLAVRVACPDGPVMLAGDAASHRDSIDRLPAPIRAVGDDAVIPGHDPAIFTRHPGPTDGVAAICR